MYAKIRFAITKNALKAAKTGLVDNNVAAVATTAAKRLNQYIKRLPEAHDEEQQHRTMHYAALNTQGR